MASGIAHVVSVNISPGGIPKKPLQAARVDFAGLEGDGHNHEKHNSPRQAVCLLDLEVIEQLRNEGYDLAPGSVGENITLRGANLASLAIGDRIVFSGGVELEYAKLRSPCYVLDAICPTLKEAMRGRIGIYAAVITPGVVTPGETVRFIRQPAAASA